MTSPPPLPGPAAGPGGTAASFPWPAGTATGIGSLPGTDPLEAARTVLGEVPDLPFLPELPGRGAHADLTGRTAALLVDLPVDLQPSGWRLVDRPGRDAGRARDALARDLDALEEAAQAGAPPRLKVQAAGPWTLAALLELPRGGRALGDAGAVRDLAGSLAAGLARLLGDLGRRLPGTELLLQLDEPSLPAVLAGRVPTPSGFGTLRAPEPATVQEHLRTAGSAAGHLVVHCCAPGAPIDLLRSAGAHALALDLAVLRRADEDAVGEAVESGAGLLLGCVPSTDRPLPDAATTLRPVRELWRRLGLPAERLPETVVVTPACGLAGASDGYARQALRACTAAARLLREEPE